MYSFRLVGLLMLLVMSGCGDNLLPSGEDKRPPVLSGSSDGSVTQKASDFSVSDSNDA